MPAACSPAALADALGVLKNVFGYPAFRAQQADIVTHVAAGGNALVLMPTGGGKSLCYQVPALMRDGVGVVISPLIALMEDQVAALCRKGVRAALLNSTLSRDESARIERSVRDGEMQFLYVSPERLLTPRCLRLLEASTVSLFAIDEAHCISEWGHDFRPEYLQLSVLHEQFGEVPRVALTATASAETRAEIVERLDLGSARVFASSFDRPNIRYRIVAKRHAHKQLLTFIRREHAGETGVVYCQTRGKVDDTAAFLDAHGLSVLPYHAGLSAEVRRDNHAWFLKQPGVIMVATIAFGMGVDKPDVRFVAHLDVPKSVEGYYQETGRAGRDGLPSEVWMAYSSYDAEPLYQMIERSTAGDAQRRVQAAKLDAMLALAETCECRRVRLLAYFGETAQPCGTCDTCVDPPARYDATGVIRQLLSCVYRVGAWCDATHVINVLRGVKTEEVVRRRHDALSAFGAGRDRCADEWRSIIRQCIALGVLGVDHTAGGGLTRTAASAGVMRCERRMMLRRWRVARAPKEKTSKSRLAADHGPETEALFERLCEWRHDVAQQRRVPGHLVFYDATLVEIAIRRPQSRWALRRIVGVGRVKAAEYGGELLCLTESQ
jgi:ATP-dependent DNA helicase RecQ